VIGGKGEWGQGGRVHEVREGCPSSLHYSWGKLLSDTKYSANFKNPMVTQGHEKS